MSGDDHRRTRQAKLDDATLSAGHRCDLTVAHHQHRRRGSSGDEGLPSRKCAAEIGGGLTCGPIDALGQVAQKQIRSDKVSRTQGETEK